MNKPQSKLWKGENNLIEQAIKKYDKEPIFYDSAAHSEQPLNKRIGFFMKSMYRNWKDYFMHQLNKEWRKYFLSTFLLLFVGIMVTFLFVGTLTLYTISILTMSQAHPLWLVLTLIVSLISFYLSFVLIGGIPLRLANRNYIVKKLGIPSNKKRVYKQHPSYRKHFLYYNYIHSTIYMTIVVTLGLVALFYFSSNIETSKIDFNQLQQEQPKTTIETYNQTKPKN